MHQAWKSEILHLHKITGNGYTRRVRAHGYYPYPTGRVRVRV